MIYAELAFEEHKESIGMHIYSQEIICTWAAATWKKQADV